MPGTEKKDSKEPEKSSGTDTASGVIEKNLGSPEALIMLSIAGAIDLVSIIPVANVFSSFLGIFIIGGWALFTRPGEVIKRVIFRLLVVAGIEFVPIISIAPSWTWFVYKVL